MCCAFVVLFTLIQSIASYQATVTLFSHINLCKKKHATFYVIMNMWLQYFSILNNFQNLQFQHTNVTNIPTSFGIHYLKIINWKHTCSGHVLYAVGSRGPGLNSGCFSFYLSRYTKACKTLAPRVTTLWKLSSAAT